MTNTVLFGVLQMPYSLAMKDTGSRIQYWQWGRQAIAEIKILKKEVEWHEEENRKLRGLLHDAMGIIWCWEPTSQSGKELKQKLSDDISAALGEKE